MTNKQFQRALAKLGMSQRQFAAMFGIGERTVHRYVAEGVTNCPAAILLTLLINRKITCDDIRKTGQSPFPSSQWEQNDLSRRIGRSPVTVVDRRLR